MRLLICAQMVDQDDPILGFFHQWIVELSKHFESIVVICLKEGAHNLPQNVRVLSLGKEDGRSLIKYILRFYYFVWHERAGYGAVLVHQSQEFAILGGVLWRLMGRRVYLWRNHYTGTLVTNLAGALSSHVFYTSKHSYTASFKNALQMPVGFDGTLFHPAGQKLPHSVLFLGRISESKRPHILADALDILKARGVECIARFVGPVGDGAYASELGKRVNLEPGVRHRDTPGIYQQSQIFVNLGDSGMYDKTLFEAAACACTVLAVSADWAELSGMPAVVPSAEALADRIASEFVHPHPPVDVSHHALSTLAKKLAMCINK